MNNRDFKGVWIPKEIWLNDNLSAIEKCLLVEIDSLDNDPEKGCFASNEYLGKFIGVSAGRAANMICDLRKRGFIVQAFFDGRNRGLKLHENVKVLQNKLHENVKADFTKTLKQTSRKREHNNTLNNTLNNSLSPREKEIETPEPIHIWGEGTETRLQKAQAALKEYFEKNSFRRREISKSAKNSCDDSQFDDELDLWIRRNADDFQITQNPVKALTSGRSNFTSWLSQTWCRDKYQTNGNNDTSNQRNGRVQQQRKADAFPSREELERKYGVL